MIQERESNGPKGKSRRSSNRLRSSSGGGGRGGGDKKERENVLQSSSSRVTTSNVVVGGKASKGDNGCKKKQKKKNKNKSKSRGRGGSSQAAAAASASSSSSPSQPSSSSSSLPQLQRSMLIELNCEEGERWYEYGEKLSGRNDTIATHPRPSSAAASAVAGNSGSSNNHGNTPHVVAKYRARADEIYSKEIQLFKSAASGSTGNSSSSDDRWMEATMKRGTLKDRIAAMSVTVNQNPIHRFQALDGLLQMAGCSITTAATATATAGATANSNNSSSSNARVAQLAAEAIEDLFLNTFLPDDRKLLTLSQRPLYLYEKQQQQQQQQQQQKQQQQRSGNSGGGGNSGNSNSSTTKTLSPRVLLLWRYEEMVKDRYDRFLRQHVAAVLRQGSAAVTAQKCAAVRTAAALLSSKPEGERDALDVLANKLGDPDRKVAAAAAHELRRVLADHPAMTATVAREVQQLAHRPHLSQTALYHCVCFLNQLRLFKDEDDDYDNDNDNDDNDNDDNHKKGNTTKSKNSSTPRTKSPSAAGAGSVSLPASLITTYFRLFEVAVSFGNNNSGGSNSNKKDVGKNRRRRDANKNKKQKRSSSSSASGRDSCAAAYSKAMKSRLLSALLTGVNRARPYLSPTDHDSVMTLQKHIDSLYRVVHQAPAAARTQALLLLFHVAGAVATAAGDEGEEEDQDDDDDDAGDATKQQKTQQMDRFYRAVYSTLSLPDQWSAGGSAGGGGGGGRKHMTMYFNLLYKTMKYDPDPVRVVAFCKRCLISTTLSGSAPVAAAGLFLVSEVARGHTHPVVLQCCEGALHGPDTRRVLDPTKREPKGALVLPKEGGEETGNDSHSDDDEEEEDNGEMKLAPVCWEISLAAHHYHPSVRTFATDFGDIDYTGDPLKDFALTPFLDKFAYRNPKQSRQQQQQRVSVAARKHLPDPRASRYSAVPVNDPAFAAASTGTTATGQDDFFREFFTERARRDRLKGIARRGQQQEQSDGDVDENAIVDAAESKDFDHEGRRSSLDFDEWESKWETDSDEEAFVDSLAEKIMEDGDDAAADLMDLDDEDPDTADWGDMYNDKDDDNDQSDEEEEDDDDDDDDDDSDDSDDNDSDPDEAPGKRKALKAVNDDDDDDDDDAFMDDDDDDDSESSGGPQDEWLVGVDNDRTGRSDFGERDDGEADGDGDDGDGDGNDDRDGDGDGDGDDGTDIDKDCNELEGALELAGEDFSWDDDDDEVDGDDGTEDEDEDGDERLSTQAEATTSTLAATTEEEKNNDNKKGEEKTHRTSVFAAAEDYQEMIDESWKSIKRPRQQQLLLGDVMTGETACDNDNDDKKPRKKKPRKHKGSKSK